MNNCEVLKEFTTLGLEGQAYDVLSLASNLAAKAKNRANVLRVAFCLFEMNRKLTGFLDNAHALMEGKRKPTASPDAEPPTAQALRSTADSLEHAHRMLDYVYESARRARLTNNTLTAGNLQSLHKRSEELLDLASWLELMAEPHHIAEVFKRAEHERMSGEIYDLSQV